MEFRTAYGERPGRIFLPGGEEAIAIYAGNELVWAKFRSSNVEVPRANIKLFAYTPSLYTESATVVSVPRALMKIIGYAPTVSGDLAVNSQVPRANLKIVGYAPTVTADRKVDVTVPRADVILNAFTPTATGGISSNVDAPFALMKITAYAPTVDTKRAVEITPPRADIILSAFTPNVSALRRVDIDPNRANLVITGYAPTVEINERIDITPPRANMVIRAYAPADVMAQRAVEITPPRANVILTAPAPTVIGGISVNITPPRADMIIRGYAPSFPTYQFDNATSLENSGSTTTFNLTVGAGAALIVFAAGNATTGARVDGVSMTALASTSNGIMYGITGLSAGVKSIAVDRSSTGSFVICAASYTGVTNISGVVTGSGSNASPTISPTGSGGIVVGGFDFTASNIATVGGVDNLRAAYRRTTGNCAAISDRLVAPVGLTGTGATGNNYTAIGARLT
ncbi:minor tail protein [Gordonia phage RobinSparkles]|nr:minor tail protein [Gordonia phage RobinSparkles]